MKMRRMRTACWITKATNTHSEQEIIIALQLQQCSRERALMLLNVTLYVRCLYCPLLLLGVVAFCNFQYISHASHQLTRCHARFGVPTALVEGSSLLRCYTVYYRDAPQKRIFFVFQDLVGHFSGTCQLFKTKTLRTFQTSGCTQGIQKVRNVCAYNPLFNFS